MRPITGIQDAAARPMTAVRGAGYSSQQRSSSLFDPLNQASAAPLLLARKEEK